MAFIDTLNRFCFFLVGQIAQGGVSAPTFAGAGLPAVSNFPTVRSGVFGYTSPGEYIYTLTGAFPSIIKTIPLLIYTGTTPALFCSAGRINTNTMGLHVQNNIGVPTDGILDAATFAIVVFL